MSNESPRNIRKSTVIRFCRREINLIYEGVRLIMCILNIQRDNTLSGNRYFFFSAPKICNFLPNSLRFSPCFSSFRKELKIVFFHLRLSMFFSPAWIFGKIDWIVFGYWCYAIVLCETVSYINAWAYASA